MALSANVTRLAARSLLQTRKFSPEILTGAGIVGLVTAGVLASKASITKLEPVIDKFEDAKDDARLENRDSNAGEMLASQTKQYKKDLAKAYRGVAFDLVKVYGPSVTLAVASTGMILGAHGIMKKRNVALAAAYKAIEGSFTEYRKRVAEEFGEEKEKDIKLGLRAVDEKDDDGKKVKKVSQSKDPNSYSGYAVFFDQLNPNWDKTPSYNLIFLRAQQQMANDRLLARGHLFLNEVYESLGMPHTTAGALVGWAIAKGDEAGDNFVDFGMYDFDSPQARAFVNGEEASILLDFNVDGVIYDKI